MVPMLAQAPGKHFLRNLVHRRTLLFQLVRRDFEQRFVGSVIGWIWGIINPLVLLVSYIYVFVIVSKQTLHGELTDNYPLFIFSGMLPWTLFSETVQRSASSLLEHANLITKSMFPAEIVPVAVFLSNLIGHALAFLLMLIALLLTHTLAWPILLLPFYTFLVGLFAIGLGWIAAALHVFLRDTAQVIGVILTLWFWLTPIIIPAKATPSRFWFILRFNPMYYAVELYRTAFFSPHPPEWRDLATFAAASAATFIGGGLFFRYVKRGFADVL